LLESEQQEVHMLNGNGKGQGKITWQVQHAIEELHAFCLVCQKAGGASRLQTNCGWCQRQMWYDDYDAWFTARLQGDDSPYLAQDAA